MNKKVKGIGLLSGGLDSMLAVKVLQEQGIEVLGLTFVTPFFGPDAGLEAGRKAGIPMLSPDISQKHLEMLKKPRYGYGSQMNPCIDCHGLMLAEAGKVMENEGADFLFTGEVLGQRPMSQRRDSLRSVEKLSGYAGKILRPLSAKLLPPTLVEQEGLVDRDRLLDIHGRSRKRQAELAHGFGITDYPQPGGGCMLTKEGFSNKLRELLRTHPEAAVREVEIIKWGRAFSLPGENICMVGRKESENGKLDSLAGRGDVWLRTLDHPGPTCVVVAPADPLVGLQEAAELAASYSDGPDDARVRVQWRHGDQGGIIVAEAVKKDRLKEMQIS
ncbi:MAG: tRNA 4-thiouridine(8) synthase ThiI [Syntrophobacteraceae bacterium]